MKTFWIVILVLALLAASFIAGRVTKSVPEPEIVMDTVIVRDTIRDTKPVPVYKYITRTDTVRLQIPGDTVMIEVEVPIERKVYQTDDYRATIEGFRPKLIDMEIYRQTQYITRTEIHTVPDNRKWGIGVQLGYGIPINGRPAPYIGIGVQYNLITW